MYRTSIYCEPRNDFVLQLFFSCKYHLWPLLTSYIDILTTFQQHLLTEYISPYWYDFPTLVFPIKEFQMVMLKSSLCKFYGRHHELVDCYGITVSQMLLDMYLASLLQYLSLFTNVNYRIRLFTGHVMVLVTRREPYVSRMCFQRTWDHPQFLVGFV